MHQKEFVKEAWVEADLYRSKDDKLGAFLAYFVEAQTDCWLDVVKELREHYPVFKEWLAIPISNTRDKLLQQNVIRAIDLECNDEVALLQKPVRC